MRVSKYWKAVVAALVAGAAALSTAVQNNQVTAGEWWTVAIAVVTAAGATWAVPNRPATRREDGVV